MSAPRIRSAIANGYEPPTVKTTSGPVRLERPRIRNAQALGFQSRIVGRGRVGAARAPFGARPVLEPLRRRPMTTRNIGVAVAVAVIVLVVIVFVL
jgi:hypothetical protein